MNYKLAKKLQDILFNPEIEPTDFLNGKYAPRDHNNRPIQLGDLVDMCGDELLGIEHVFDGGIDGKEKLWWASAKNDGAAGETIEEAVAYLWLMLQKRK